MSTDSEPKGRVLSRRELRELRAKGGEAAVRQALAETDEPAPPERPAAPPHVVASAASAPDANRTLTRKELRRLRTNEVPIIAEAPSDAGDEPVEDRPELTESADAVEAPAADADGVDEETLDESASVEEPDDGPEAAADDDASAADDAETATTAEEQPYDSGDDVPDAEATEVDEERRVMPWENPAPERAQERPTEETTQLPLTVIDPSGAQAAEPDEAAPDSESASDPAQPDDAAQPTVNPLFGAGVAQKPQQQTSKRTFDELLERNDPTSPSSIILTSSHRLPEGFGSQGSARGTTDGRDVDSVLVDGELPAHSSPTPIAASSAISTQNPASEVIRPPQPEKGRGLILTLSITAGVLGIAVIGALGAAYAMGVFNQ